MGTSPIIFHREDYCNICHTNKSIECYDEYDNPLNYTLLLDAIHANKNIGDVFNKRRLSYMKCKKCNTVYLLDWSKNINYPVPLIDTFKLMIFLNEI